MFCHIKRKMMSIYRNDYHYRIVTYIIRTKWGNRIKRKYIYISKQNSEIYSSKVLHHLDFFIFLSDILTNNFKPSFFNLHSLKEFYNVYDKTKIRCGNDFRNN